MTASGYGSSFEYFFEKLQKLFKSSDEILGILCGWVCQ
ncbi:hypothetical protein J918_0865 [Acinetobacter baumannii 25493_5]|nr:hypothetical protein J922_0835 [Acinetobacter baumannii 25493_9]EYD48672.1 hypothetical protein J918_0865 [Acinetobacter baumannii 25493_5]EYD52090.1 hypothetical protein J917_1257 [Acinetobacter baumannii 25493_4]EYR92135.1 hypothetical protein K011_1714 [Acinetobacter baumannii 25569_5]